MLKLINVSKKYLKNNKDYFYAINNVSYEFNKYGLYFIYGKSGSGKSTLANMIASFENIDEGYIECDGILINNLKGKTLNYYRSKIIGVIFQHYELINDLNVIDNLNICSIISNNLSLKQKNYIKNLLKRFDLLDLKDKKVEDLSGGEMQRVAIARALVNDPKIIIADEPTGALDENNSKIVIDYLKELSKDHIVILISHNYDLIVKYADEIIHIEDGRIKENKKVLKTCSYKKIKNHFTKSNISFFIKQSFKNLLKNKTKSILIFVSICFVLIILSSIIGFMNGSNIFLSNETRKRFDYSSATISLIEKISIDNSFLDLNRLERMSHEDINNLISNYDYIACGLNFDKLFEGFSLYFNNELIDNALLKYVYNFESVDKNLITESYQNVKEGIYINKSFQEKIIKKFNISSCLGQQINIKIKKELSFNNINNNDLLNDYFVFDKTFFIKGVVDEFNFLSTPKIYLSYEDIALNLKNNLAIEISKYLKKDYSWFDYILDIDNKNAISGYSHYLFLTDNDYINEYELFINKINQSDNIEISCDGLILKNTFYDIIYAVKVGLFIFSILITFSCILIIGISSFSSFAFNKKKNAILLALGIDNKSLFSFYIFENLIILFFSLISSFCLSFLMEPLINFLIYKIFGFSNLIKIPFFIFLNIPFLFPILLITCSFFVVLFSTLLPIYFSKNINIRKELADE